MSETPCRRGLVALGDSITNGGGNMALGVYPRSWAQWLAMALELPYTSLAFDGATAPGVVLGQLPHLGDAYDLGALFIGANDVRSIDWDPVAFERDYTTALEALTARAPRVLALTIPLDLGRPRAGPKVADANALIRRLAEAAGAIVAGLDDLRCWRHVLPDAVHPHAVGQLEIADRAARALGSERVPSALVERDRGPLAEARWARDWSRMWVRDVIRRIREKP
jgi:lysophospholipase L1-like esterase